MGVDGWIDGWIDGWMDDGWGNTLGLETKMGMLALMQPSEPKTFLSSIFGAGDALPEVTQRGRTGICISTQVSSDAEAGCEDVSNWRSLTEKILSSGGIKSSLRSGKKPQLITRAK